METFIAKQRQKLLEENAKKLLEDKKSRSSIKPKVTENEPVFKDLKNLDGTKKKTNDVSQSLIQQNTAIVESNALIESMNNITLTFFEKDENKHLLEMLPQDLEFEKSITTIFTMTKEYPPELVNNLLNYLQYSVKKILIKKKIQDIKDSMSTSLSDFEKMIALLLDFLENIEPGNDLYDNYTEFVRKLGNGFRETDPQSFLFYMENVGLDLLLRFSKLHSNKNDVIICIITSVVPEDENSRLRILERLSKILKSDLQTLSGILALLVETENFEMYDEMIFDYYLSRARDILDYSYPKMKVNGLKILNELSKQNLSKLFLDLPKLQKLSSMTWWEVQAQILIICCNQLDFIENQVNPENTSQYNLEQTLTMEQNSYGNQDGAIPEIKEDPHNQSRENDNRYNNYNENMSRADMDRTQESEQFDMKQFLESKRDYVQSMLDLINKIFHKYANNKVIIVGLVYLARITNYFPSLCKRYLEVLLSTIETIRITVLNTEEENNYPTHLIKSKTIFSFYFFIYIFSL